jgi:hypothetical protein
MKSINLFSIIIATLVFLTGCAKEERTNFNVSGYLISKGDVMGNAEVDIDGLEQYKTKSDSEGYFSITGVSTGNHQLNVNNSYENGGYVQKSYEIEVNQDLTFDGLLLPNPVSLVLLKLDSATNKVAISWNKSSAVDFREYKLYLST